MAEYKLNSSNVVSASVQAKQLNALLQNIFANGAEGVDADNELIGLAYDLAGNICLFMDKLEERENDKSS
jgi:hypothetical protein